MFCENCGKELEVGAKFCMKCGAKIPSHEMSTLHKVEEKWWDRLFKVAYIIAYLPLILILILVWSSSVSSYDYYTRTYTDTPGIAVWYCFLTILIYFGIMRLIKISYLYIAKGIKPDWKEEFKRLF